MILDEFLKCQQMQVGITAAALHLQFHWLLRNMATSSSRGSHYGLIGPVLDSSPFSSAMAVQQVRTWKVSHVSQVVAMH